VDYLVLLGRVYLVYTGTEDAPIDGTPVDDTTLNMVIDIPAGINAMVVEASVHMSDMTTGTIAQAMLEIDTKNRYTSGGTAFTPLNMHTGFGYGGGGCLAYVGPDITAAAKSVGSREVWRWQISNDAKATELADEFRNGLYTAKINTPAIVTGPGSILLHFGSATADVKTYSQLKFAIL